MRFVMSDVMPVREVTLEATIFLFSFVMILLTFTLGAPALNIFMPYTEAGGSFLAKFHPASWLSVILLGVIVFNYSILGYMLVRHVVFGSLLMVLLIIWLALRGKGALLATFMDVHLAPCILLLGLSCLSPVRVRSLLQIFVVAAAINVVIVAVEYVSQQTLLPTERQELFFRPSGLFAHPIISGVLFCCAMFLTTHGVVSGKAIRPLLLLFLFGVVLCGVRGPLAIAGVIYLHHMLRPSVPREHWSDYVFDFGLVVLIPLTGMLAYSIGALDRILELGLWEDSAQSRFYIFDVIDFLTPHEFWNGIDSYEFMELLAIETTGGRYIENAFVSVLLQAGFPIAVFLGVFLWVVYFYSLRRSLVFTLMFAQVVISTLGFGVKNMIPMAMAMTAYWVWRNSSTSGDAI